MDMETEELCDDVLLEIFNRLDAGSLKNAALVCKSWDRVIGSSLSTMSKFTLNIHHKNKNLEDISSLTRRYQSIDIKLGTNDPWKLKLLTKVSRLHGSQVRKLAFNDTYLHYDIKSIAEFFGNLPKLESLEFSGVYFGRERRMRLRAINPDALKQLKTLKVSRSCWTLFDFLTGVQVLNLQVDNINCYQYSQCLPNFLTEARTLESIRADFNAHETFEENFSADFTFKLKKFDFDSFVSSYFEESFVSFLITHAATLEELSFKNMFPTSTFVAIFNHLKCLKKLTVPCCYQSEIEQNFDQLRPLKSLKELNLGRACYEPPFVSRLLRFCPNLEVPNFEIYTANSTELLKTLSVNNPKITFLSLFNWKITDPSTVRRFRFLKTLHLQTLLDADTFINILTNSRSLETLNIQWVYEGVMSVEVLQILRVQSNLKHLKVGGSFETAKLIHDELMKNHGKLETLELTVKVFSNVSRTFCLNFSRDSLDSDSRRPTASEFFSILNAPETEKPQLPFCASLSVVGTFRNFFKLSNPIPK